MVQLPLSPQVAHNLTPIFGIMQKLLFPLQPYVQV